MGSDDGNVYAFGFRAIHDVAVTNVVPGKTVVGHDFNVKISVTLANEGGFAETFKVTAHANATSITSQNITLPIGTSATAAFVWNITDFAYGNYTISINITLAQGETNNGTGPYTYGTFKVTIPGDINGDGYVNLKDLGLITGHWQQTVPPAPANVDIMNVGVINLRDLGIVTGNWQKHA